MAASDPALIPAILYELEFRDRKPARALKEKLKGKSASSRASRPGEIGASPAFDGRTPVKKGKPRVRANQEPLKFPPTEEQTAAVAAFMEGKSLKVTAFAGAGKTSTLRMMTRARDGRGLYLAFNRSIAEEAHGTFASGVDCRTTHSVAARHVRSGRKFKSKKMFGSIGPVQLAEELNLKPLNLADKTTLTPVQQAHLILRTLTKFCQTDDENLIPNHVPMSGRLLGLADEVKEEAKRWVRAQAAITWQRKLDPSDVVPLGHDGYLKLWALDRPILDYEYVMLDEAQDSNPVILSVLKAQSSQIVYVGDRHQQIYEWRGAVNAMDAIATDLDCLISRSFRFGNAIAAAATAVISVLGEQNPIKGNASIHSTISDQGDARTILARTNTRVISEALKLLDEQRKVHIVGGTDELKRLVGDVFSLMKGEPGSHPDFFGFKSWEEVVEFSDTEEGESLRPFVSLVHQHGPGGLWACIRRVEAEEKDADVVISTAHKGKGREWASVRIADDFSASANEAGFVPEEEVRLFYVAITRAKERLVIDGELLSAFMNLRLHRHH